MTLAVFVGAAVEDSAGEGQTSGHVHLVLDLPVIAAPVLDVKLSGFSDNGVRMVWHRSSKFKVQSSKFEEKTASSLITFHYSLFTVNTN